MANNLREFFDEVSKNIEIEDRTFIDNIPDEVEIPENFKEAFYSNYLTIDAAKNHSDINTYFKGKNLGSVDSQLKAFYKQNDMMDVYKELEAEGDTLVKLKKTFEVLKDLKNGGKNDENTKELKKQYEQKFAELQQELEKRKDYVEPTEIERLKQEMDSKLFGYNLNSILSRKQYGEGWEVDEVSILVNGKLNQLPYTFKIENDVVVPYEKENPELKAFKNGKPLTFEEIVNELTLKYEKKSDKPQEQRRNVVVESKNDNAHYLGAKPYNPFS